MNIERFGVTCDGTYLTMSSASFECTVLSMVLIGDLEDVLFSSS